MFLYDAEQKVGASITNQNLTFQIIEWQNRIFTDFQGVFHYSHSSHV